MCVHSATHHLRLHLAICAEGSRVRAGCRLLTTPLRVLRAVAMHASVGGPLPMLGWYAVGSVGDHSEPCPSRMYGKLWSSVWLAAPADVCLGWGVHGAVVCM